VRGRLPSHTMQSSIRHMQLVVSQIDTAVDVILTLLLATTPLAAHLVSSEQPDGCWFSYQGRPAHNCLKTIVHQHTSIKRTCGCRQVEEALSTLMFALLSISFKIWQVHSKHQRAKHSPRNVSNPSESQTPHIAPVLFISCLCWHAGQEFHTAF